MELVYHPYVMCASSIENNPFGWAKERIWDDVSPTTKIIQDRVITEAVQWTVFFGVGYVLHNHVEMKPVKQVVAKIISPFVSSIDAIADNVLPVLETEEQATIRKKMSKDERAYFYADELLDLGLSVGLAIVLQSKMQDWMDNKRGVGVEHTSQAVTAHPSHFVEKLIPNPYDRAAIADRIAGWGTFALGNVILPTQNRQAQEAISGILEKCGVEKKQAQSAGAFAINYCLPNLVGMATSVGILSSQHGQHAKG